jgi:hypothetical protein
MFQRQVWDDKEDPIINDEIVEGKGRRQTMTAKLRHWIHEFVLNNAEPLKLYKV